MKVILTLEETKNFLRVDNTDDDTYINICIQGAEDYLKSNTGLNNLDNTNARAKIYCLCLVNDWYNNKSYTLGTVNISNKTRLTLNSIAFQLVIEDKVKQSGSDTNV